MDLLERAIEPRNSLDQPVLSTLSHGCGRHVSSHCRTFSLHSAAAAAAAKLTAVQQSSLRRLQLSPDMDRPSAMIGAIRHRCAATLGRWSEQHLHFLPGRPERRACSVPVPLRHRLLTCAPPTYIALSVSHFTTPSHLTLSRPPHLSFRLNSPHVLSNVPPHPVSLFLLQSNLTLSHVT